MNERMMETMAGSKTHAGRATSTLIAGLLLAGVVSHPAVARDADLSDVAGFWVYEFTCTDPAGNTYGPPVGVKIEPDGTVYDFIASDAIGDMRRGQWAGFEFQVLFRDIAYPAQLGHQEFGYDNVRLNLEPGGDLFVGRHIYAIDFGSTEWCRCDGVRLYRLPKGEAPALEYTKEAQLRPLVCRNITAPDMGSSPDWGQRLRRRR